MQRKRACQQWKVKKFYQLIVEWQEKGKILENLISKDSLKAKEKVGGHCLKKAE